MRSFRNFGKHVAAIHALVKLIGKYESDTFSASGSGITDRQCEAVAASIVRRAIDHIDGDQIARALYDSKRWC